MADQGFRPPPRKKNALDNSKLKMSAPSPTAPGKNAALVWSLVKNAPRITVFTGDPEEQNERMGWGKINANLDMPTFYVLMGLIKESLTAEPGWKMKIENKNFTFFGGKRSLTPEVVSELHVGKDNSGRCWISVTAANRPKIQFFFNAPEFHSLYDAKNEPLSNGEVSKRYTAAYIRALELIMASVATSSWEDPPPPKDRQGGGNFNRSGAGGGGGQRPAPPANDAGDDIPF